MDDIFVVQDGCVYGPRQIMRHEQSGETYYVALPMNGLLQLATIGLWHFQEGDGGDYDSTAIVEKQITFVALLQKQSLYVTPVSLIAIRTIDRWYTWSEFCFSVPPVLFESQHH